MTSPPPERVPPLFDELAELPELARARRLSEMESAEPGLARELRGLLDADSAAGDFLGVLSRPGPVPRSEAPQAWPTSQETHIGPYRTLRPLGRGGMATVWLAYDERLDREVALKVLTGVDIDVDIDVASDDVGSGPTHRSKARSRLLAEARLAAQLDHPHIASVYDFGETAEGEPYIAMAYCAGGSLANRLARAGAMPLPDVLHVARQLASALGAAHGRGIVHRDVKPANVLFDANDAVRLADFGIALLESQNAMRTGTVRGTTAYLAPEHLRGEALDHRADLWAFGVTLYEMLAGRRPFEGASGAAVLYDILTASPEPITQPVTRIAGDPSDRESFAALSALVFHLLEKEPGLRPASATDVERTLIAIQSGAAGRSPVRSPVRSPARRAPPMPATPLTPLVGRERELAQAAALLARSRLLTLTGPGGTGKTRLATELARLSKGRYSDGVHVVRLAATAGPALVASAIAQAIGVRESAGARPAEQVARFFAARQALLVLDSFEHVLAAAALVRDLLGAAPRLTVLVTSRAPLQLQGEQEFPVPPLDLPEPQARSTDAIAGAESVRLFVQRAQASRPDFALTADNAADVAAICRRLDGLPLAIELAATRIKLLAPSALRARLEQRLDLLHSDAVDVEPRHRTLHDVVDWSYGLLTTAEQALLRLLSVFAGGFTLDAVAAVAPDSADGTTAPATVDVLDRVASLVDRSLIMPRHEADGEPRFHLLETIREYALARLRDAGEEAAARASHRAYFLALAEQAAPQLRGPTQVAWLARLEREHDNLRAAFDGAEASDDVAAGVRLAVALHWFWLGSRSFLGQTIERLQALDARVGTSERPDVPPALHARLLTTIGLLTGVRGDHFGVPHRYHEASLAAYERAGDSAGAATALNHVGWTCFMLGDVEGAAARSREALSRHRAANDLLGVATASINLGWVALARGQLADAEQLFSEALAIHRERRDRRASAYALGHVASAAVLRGDLARATALYDEVDELAAPLGDRVLQPTFAARRETARYELGAPAHETLRCLEQEILPQLREAGHAWSIGFVLAAIGRIRTDAGDLAGAQAVLDESVAVRRGVGNRSGVAESTALLAELARRAGDHAVAEARWQESLRERQAMGEAIGVLECQEGLARLALDRGDPERAAELRGAAAVERDRLGAPASPRDQDAQAPGVD